MRIYIKDINWAEVVYYYWSLVGGCITGVYLLIK